MATRMMMMCCLLLKVLLIRGRQLILDFQVSLVFQAQLRFNDECFTIVVGMMIYDCWGVIFIGFQKWGSAMLPRQRRSAQAKADTEATAATVEILRRESST